MHLPLIQICLVGVYMTPCSLLYKLLFLSSLLVCCLRELDKSYFHFYLELKLCFGLTNKIKNANGQCLLNQHITYVLDTNSTFKQSVYCSHVMIAATEDFSCPLPK